MNKRELFTTEYLVILDKKTVGAYFKLIDSQEMFKKLITGESGTGVDITTSKATYNGEQFEFKVRHGTVPEKEQRYFYVSVSTDNNEFNNYSKFLKMVRSTILEQNFIIETLQDDVSFFYSTKAYSMIHEIENLMRKFITFFMIANVGKDWVSANTPNHVKESIAKCKPRDYASELQKLDFKDLGYFLFNKYQKSENSFLHKKIASYLSVADINLRELQSFIPRSNWDLYFKNHVDFEGSSLEKKWERLYELRNSVAHTSSLNRDKYEEIKDLVEEVGPILQKAFNTLGKLKLDTSERLAISETVATSLDAEIASYFSKISNIEEELRSLAPNMYEKSFSDLLDFLYKEQKISEFTYDKLIKLIALKDNLSFDSSPSSESINMLASKINEVQSTIQDTWSIEVYNALKGLGGKSSLENIYYKIEKDTKRSLFGSWKTSVRRAIYNNSSDVELYNGKYDIYQQVSKGVWMIRRNIDPLMLNEFLGANNA